MKTRSKIIILISTILSLIIIAFSIAIYTFIERYSYDDFYKRLEFRSKSYSNRYLNSFNDSLNTNEFLDIHLDELEDEKYYILKKDENYSNKELAYQNNLPSRLLKSIEPGITGNYQDGNIFYSGIYVENEEKEPFYVITSAHNYYYDHHMSYLKSVISVALVVSTLIIFLISAWLSKWITQPIKRITNDVARIGSDNLFTRLEYHYKDDEMSELVEAFNDMLNRLETSFETQSNFISNASHELNTPLTSIMGEADLALSRERTAEYYKESLTQILSEAEKLNKKTKALLFLAQTAFNGKTLVFKNTRIDQLIFDVQETIDRIYPENQVTIDLSLLPENHLKLKVFGNEQLLHLALSNIIVNACKYSNNQPVTVSLGGSENEIIIFVQDKGIGIPSNELKYIYDPFFRASNTKNYEGYGIGLPLTRNIIRIHHGKLLVTSDENIGTVVEMRFPISTVRTVQ